MTTTTATATAVKTTVKPSANENAAPGVGRGAVVDFIDLGWWPSFNIADSCIVVGGALAVLLAGRGRGIDGTRAAAGDEQGARADETA